MALGGGGGALIAKELAVSPQQVVVSREKEKLALQELNDRYMSMLVSNGWSSLGLKSSKSGVEL